MFSGIGLYVTSPCITTTTTTPNVGSAFAVTSHCIEGDLNDLKEGNLRN